MPAEMNVDQGAGVIIIGQIAYFAQDTRRNLVAGV
jgi:hypothetical protein